MENALKISAIAITLNEAENIGPFMQSLWFADEIIIVDSFSTDETLEIASQNERVKIHKREFDNFSAQKNFALSKATNDWVVFFDLDEKIAPELADEILETLKKPKAKGYFVKRDFYFMGKQIKYSGYQNDWVIRIFNKNYCQYNENLVHETLKVNGETAKLKITMPHYSYKTMDEYTEKLHRYSALQAEMLYAKKVRPTLYHFFFRPWYRFSHQFIIRLGILDGKEGFILAYLSAFSTFKRYVNLWLLYRKIN